MHRPRAIASELEELLERQRGERKVVQFLTKHPELLLHYFRNRGGHSQYVLTEVSLAGELYMDAVVLVGSSGAWTGYFIEFEPVGDTVFNKDGTYSRRTKTALSQIANWREYMRLNPTQFRRKLAKLCQTKDRLRPPNPDEEPSTLSNHRLKDPETYMWERFWIISGRRKSLSSSVRRLMARQMSESDVFMGTYDGFLDLARRLQ